MLSLLGNSIRERRLRVASLVALVAGIAFGVWAQAFDPLQDVQNVISDALFEQETASENVVVVAIDDNALSAHGRIGEWSRDLHAQTINELTAAGARTIFYDILFAEASRIDPEGDAALARAISDSGLVVLPVAGDGEANETDAGPVFDEITLPFEALRDGATLAHVNLPPDGDGRVRTVPVQISDAEGNTYPAASIAAVYRQFGRDAPVPLPVEGGGLDLFGRTAPLEDGDTFRINYAGPARPPGQGGSYLALPFDDVRAGNFDASLVAGKIVIVGAMAAALDVQPAPLLDTAYGAEIHANAVDTLLRDRFIRTTGGLTTFLTTIVLVVAAALFLPRWRPIFSLATVTGFIVAYAVFGVYMFSQGWIIEFVDPPVGLVIATVVALSYSVISERSTAREMQDLFGRYVSPQVARELLERADRGQLKLGGELREVTVLFGDIRGFTPLSARTPPDELVALLNEHFDVIISRIMENGGIINKFAGDAVMAFWNAPEDQTGHALSACHAALEAQDLLEKLSDAPVARWGFGISTGVALAGNVGSGRRLEYTVIGDSVNLGARLCGVAPAGDVWINASTREQIGALLEVEELPPQPIKGIEGMVTAYRLKRPVAQEPLEVGGKR